MIFIGIVGLVFIIWFNIKMAKGLNSKVLKYYEKTADGFASVSYLRKRARKNWPFYLLSFFILFISLLLIFYDLLHDFDLSYSIAFILTILMYFYIMYLVNHILIQGESVIKGGRYDKKQHQILTKLILIYFSRYIFFIVTYIPILVICFSIYNASFNYWFILSLIIFFISCFSFIIMEKHEVNIFLKFFQAEHYENDDLQKFVNNLLPNVKLYYFESNHIKIAQAFALTQNKEKAVLISNYLVDNLTIDELKAVIAHEIGHFHYNHALKRGHLILVGYGLSILISFFLLYILDIQGFLFNLIHLLYIYIYFVIYKNKVNQKQETEADLYILIVNIDKDVAKSMLTKLSTLNLVPMKGEKHEKYHSTHPVIQKRIDSIEKN